MKSVLRHSVFFVTIYSFVTLAAKKRHNINIGDSEDCQAEVLNDSFISECLHWHNIYRKQHRAAPLKISPQLCERAQFWANHLAHTNSFSYSTEKSVGQNIFCRLNAKNYENDVTAEEVVSSWYSSYKNYFYNRNSDILHVNVNAGSFTQMVWRKTEYLGIGRAMSRYGKFLVVANYQPVGNMCGLFHQNVSPPIGSQRIMYN